MLKIDTRAAVDAIRKALGDIPALALEAANKEARRTAYRVANDAKKAVMKGPKTGRIYKREGKEGTNSSTIHIASAPGQAPATDKGLLASGIVSRARKLNAEAGATMRYAPFLEFGTSRGLKPRPFLKPALDAHIDDHIARVVTAVKAVKAAMQKDF